MAILEILQFPDPRLRIKAELINHIDAEIKRIVEDMYETMYHAQGVGLAATQVNIHKQIFVMDISEDRSKPVCVINPVIVKKEGSIIEDEACLSVAGEYEKVERATYVEMTGMDLEGNTIEFKAQGLLAKCIQHEVDHLNGILYVDHLSRLKLERIRARILKNQRKNNN